MNELEPRKGWRPSTPLGGWVTAALTAAPIPQSLLERLDAQDEAEIQSALEAKEDEWVRRIATLRDGNGYRKLWAHYISQTSLSDEQFVERTRVFNTRVASAEDPEDRVRFTFSAVRLWTEPDPLVYFAGMDERIARWETAELSRDE